MLLNTLDLLLVAELAPDDATLELAVEDDELLPLLDCDDSDEDVAAG